MNRSHSAYKINVHTKDKAAPNDKVVDEERIIALWQFVRYKVITNYWKFFESIKHLSKQDLKGLSQEEMMDLSLIHI